ncbi:MAG: LacI family DNA-binding transcriptional regulator [Phycisphaeraceae bacterium]|nr:LacI family DNA-binding transcriptional regulator [Phycisphaeraceae bacterium]
MSITEIAKLAGVSTATVSRVINSYPNVSPRSVKRVTRAMEGMGYKAQPRGRGGRRSELDCVALLVSSHHMLDPYASTGHFFTLAVEQALRQRQLGMILTDIAGSTSLPEYVLRGKVRGVIVTGHNPKSELVEQLAKVPHVWLASHRTRSGDVVLSGNEIVGRLAAEHLLGRGHQRIGALNLMPDAGAKVRIRFFRMFIEEAARCFRGYLGPDEVEKAWQEDLDMDWLEGEVSVLIEQMLADPQRPTGLFVPSDFQAAIVQRVLIKRGLKVGVDLEIVSTDMEKGALLGLYPRPTTIDLNPRAMGRRAVEHLMMRIANPQHERVQVVLEPKLIPGDELRQDWTDASA